MHQVGPRIRQDGYEVFLAQRLQLHPDRQTALQFGQHIAGLGHMERAAGDKQDVVGLHRAILGGNCRPFDKGQQIALHAFTADRTATHIGYGDLVDFIEEHDAVGLRIGQSHPRHIVLIHPFFGFFVDQLVPGIGHLQLAPLFRRAAKSLAHDVAEIDHPDIAAHAGQFHRHRRRIFHLDFNLGVVHRVLHDPLTEAFAGRLAGIFTDKRMQQAVHRRLRGRFAHGVTAAILFQPDGVFGQIAGDLFNVAPDIAHFGELGRFDFHKRGVDQLGKAAADLGLAAARGPDHQYVFRSHLVAQIRIEALAPPAVAQGNSHSALRFGLPDDVFVQRRDDSFRGKIVVHGNTRRRNQMVSTVTRSLVKTQMSAATAMALRAIVSASVS